MEKLLICIPTYKRTEKLEKILSTIPSNLDVVISDNGGFTDDFLKDKYENAHFFGSEVVIDMFFNWNNAIEISDSEYFMIPCDDDEYLPNSFSTIFKYLDKYPEKDIFVFGHNVIDGESNILSRWCPGKLACYDSPYGFELFRYGVEARMPSIVFKRSFIKKIGALDTQYRLTAADSDLIQRALLYGNSIFIPEVVASYRSWDGGLTAQKQASDLWFEEIKYWTNKISRLASEQYNKHGKIFESGKYKDEIMARNILSAATSLFRKDKKECHDFMDKYGVPKNCTWKSKFNLLKLKIKTYI